MADFLTAHKHVMANEGGYAFNPRDTGGETYKGVSRNNWPKWGGWKYIDGVKTGMVKQPVYGTEEYRNWVKYLNKALAGINALQNLVLEFYRKNFWKQLDGINSQDVATWVYDKDVNTGSMGSRWLQAACGVLVDGCVGPRTIAAANSANPSDLLYDMQEDAKDFYLHQAQKPGQAQFWRSWISRVGLTPDRLAAANIEAHNAGIIA